MIKILYKGEFATESTLFRNGAKVETQLPPEKDDRSTAFSATDLVASALGACLLTVMGRSAVAHDFSTEGSEVEVSYDIDYTTKRFRKIELKFIFPKYNFTDKQKKILEAAESECPISRSMHPDVQQIMTFQYN